MFDILHDWDDAHVHYIVRRCAHAATPHSHFLIIEAAGRQQTNTEAGNLAVLAIFRGRDRRIDELGDLAAGPNLVLSLPCDQTVGRRT